MRAFEKYVAKVMRDVKPLQRRRARQDLMSDLEGELIETTRRQPGEDPAETASRIVRQRPAPQDVALGYARATTTLIEPAAFPLYRQVLRIAVVTCGVSVAATLLAMGNLGIASMLGKLCISLAIVFSMITLNFHLLGRLGWEGDGATTILAALGKSGAQPARHAQLLFRACLTVVMLTVLCLSPAWVGFPMFVGVPYPSLHVYPLLSQWFLGWPRMLLCGWLLIALSAIGWRALGREGLRGQRIISIAGALLVSTIMILGDVLHAPSADEVQWLPPAAEGVLRDLLPGLLFMLNVGIWVWVLLTLMSSLRPPSLKGHRR
jgi:hypothetical protein